MNPVADQSFRWPPREQIPLDREFRLLIETVKSNRNADEYLPRFLVVRSCGYIEQSIKTLCRGLVEEKSYGLVKSFALSNLERTRNPRPDVILEQIGRFDAALGQELADFMDEDNSTVRQDLLFLVDRRNRIAHGENEGMGMNRSLALAKTASLLVDWLVLRLNPNSPRSVRR